MTTRPTGTLGSSLHWRSRVTALWSSLPERKRLLIIDDDRRLLTLLQILFEPDYEIQTAMNGTTALFLVGEFSPDVIILDLEMPDMNGRNVYASLREQGVQAPVLILSAFGAERATAELGANAFVNKPFEPTVLLNAVQALIVN